MAKLNRHAKNWALDRVENDDPLLWNEFIKNMRDYIGEPDALIAKYKTKAVKNAAKKLYAERVAHKKKVHRLGSTRGRY